jgi:hypothetical protein
MEISGFSVCGHTSQTHTLLESSGSHKPAHQKKEQIARHEPQGLKAAS